MIVNALSCIRPSMHLARLLNCLALGVGLLLQSAVWAQSAPQVPEPKLKAGDALSLIVYSHEGYSTELGVFEDGTIVNHNLGRMLVKGLTVAQVREMIVAKLKEKIKDPIVSLILKSQRPDKVFIIGPEKGSGVLELLPGMDVRRLVATVSLPADPDALDVVIYRIDGSRQNVDLWGVLQGKPGVWNGLLQPDDIITFIPKPFIKVWLLGPFSKGGEVKVREGLDIYEAMAELGGVTTTPLLPDEAFFLIRRGPDTIRVPVRKDPYKRGLILQAGDVIMVDLPKMIRVFVAGEASSPGEFQVREDLPLSKLMLQAHGATDIGTLSNVLLFRGSDILTVDATGPITGQKPSDFRLQDGDFFWVQRNERSLYAFGAINSPGKFLFRDGVTMNAADLLSRVGGTSTSGSLRRVLLLRPNAEGKYIGTRFNLDEFIKDGKVASNPELHPGDIVFFGEPKGITLGTVGQLVSGALLYDALYKGKIK